MKLKKRIAITIAFYNGEADKVMKGYEELKKKGLGHAQIYLKGLEKLKN